MSELRERQDDQAAPLEENKGRHALKRNVSAQVRERVDRQRAECVFVARGCAEKSSLRTTIGGRPCSANLARRKCRRIPRFANDNPVSTIRLVGMRFAT